jgi:hypothetical protein
VLADYGTQCRHSICEILGNGVGVMATAASLSPHDHLLLAAGGRTPGRGALCVGMLGRPGVHFDTNAHGLRHDKKPIDAEAIGLSTQQS